ncbi:MAG: hypothetical protein K1Y02_18875 [Candidatus Hydrogenedentes bacterium]|nr:hypothetical protein [Candidatus Hydrogenedentota bacterium]
MGPRKVSFAALSVLIVLYAAGCGRGGNLPAVLWNIDEQGVLDVTNEKIDLRDNEATVDLRHSNSYCPSGLGDVIDGPPEVKAVTFIYDLPQSGKYWLHVVWNPGGSGDESFAVEFNGDALGEVTRVKGADNAPNQTSTFELPQNAGENTLVLRRISGDGLKFRRIALTSIPELDEIVVPTPTPPSSESRNEDTVSMDSVSEAQTVNPSLPFKDEASYSQNIGEPGLLLKSDHVWLFAPRTREKEANIVIPYLARAYDALRRIVGVDTTYTIIVYHFPEGNPNARGSTSECTLWYGYPNLALEKQEEWLKCTVPHVSGYIEEMAHNFVDATKANFGWEMAGWSIGMKASLEVADNPVLRQSLDDTRRVQAETFERYRAAGNVFPSDIEPNKADRIHAYLLWQCERQYGARFWEDFFTEVRKERQRLYDAINVVGEERVRDERYRITVECFDRLPGLNFSQRLDEAGISRTIAVQSLLPTEPGWNHRLQ